MERKVLNNFIINIRIESMINIAVKISYLKDKKHLQNVRFSILHLSKKFKQLKNSHIIKLHDDYCYFKKQPASASFRHIKIECHGAITIDKMIENLKQIYHHLPLSSNDIKCATITYGEQPSGSIDIPCLHILLYKPKVTYEQINEYVNIAKLQSKLIT